MEGFGGPRIDVSRRRAVGSGTGSPEPIPRPPSPLGRPSDPRRRPGRGTGRRSGPARRPRGGGDPLHRLHPPPLVGARGPGRRPRTGVGGGDARMVQALFVVSCAFVGFLWAGPARRRHPTHRPPGGRRDLDPGDRGPVLDRLGGRARVLARPGPAPDPFPAAAVPSDGPRGSGLGARPQPAPARAFYEPAEAAEQLKKAVIRGVATYVGLLLAAYLILYWMLGWMARQLAPVSP